MVQPTKEGPRVDRRDSIKARLDVYLLAIQAAMYVINATTASFLRELIIHGSAR